MIWAELADPYFVSVHEHGRLHRLAVDVRAVQAVHVDNVELVALPSKLGVPAASGDVVEEDVAARMSARGCDWLIQREISCP